MKCLHIETLKYEAQSSANIFNDIVWLLENGTMICGNKNTLKEYLNKNIKLIETFYPLKKG